MMQVDKEYYENLTPERVDTIFEKLGHVPGPHAPSSRRDP
jgi:hypothetical protein